MNRPRLRRAAVPAGLALLHVLAVVLGRATAAQGDASVVWPAAGVAFVWLARSWRRPRERRRDAALLVLSGTTALLLTGQPAGAAVLFGLAGALEALTACWVQRRLQPRGARLRRPGDLWVLLLALACGSLAGGLLITGVAVLALGLGPQGAVLLGWVVRHTAGALAVAVVWVRTADRRDPPVPAQAGPVEVVAVLAGCGALLTWLFEQPGNSSLAFLMAPLAVWAGLRMSARAAVVCVVLGGTAVVLATAAGIGAFHDLPAQRAALDAQLLALVLPVVVVPLVLHREERARLDAEVRAVHREAATALEHRARHDALTGLPNRVLLHERLERALADGPAGLLFCDLDGFKEVNDTAGHRAGDAVLQHVAERFTASLRGPATLARLGGDEFAVLCPGASTAGELRAAAELLVAALREPVATGAGVFRVGVSVGAALADPQAPPPGPAERLLADADAAMYRAKRAGGRRVHVHEGHVHEGHVHEGRAHGACEGGSPAGAAPRQAVAPGPSSSGGTRQ
ncbi:diguanylate cyclase domain-containing protein [Kineococcus gypseus]|uniref:diguanylate cyclase domain-containing protein n=1 Tax=Kineococcus gypseus TaxID=1637102 RepID=UPI003D7CD32F